jgi:hypothetical protein
MCVSLVRFASAPKHRDDQFPTFSLASPIARQVSEAMERDERVVLSFNSQPKYPSQSQSLASSMYVPPLPSAQSNGEPSDFGGLFDNSSMSFFDQCEEEFSKGLNKSNIDKIVGKYELAFLNGSKKR